MLAPLHLPSPPPLGSLSDDVPLALFLDFDGTLVELADLPTSIAVPARLKERLETLARRLDGRLALVSGRSVADLECQLGRPQFARAGSHGLERVLADGTALGEVPSALPEAALNSLDAFARERGFLLEAKPHGAALHFRAAPRLEASGAEFADRLARQHALEVKRGNCVVELVSPGADKGGAVRAFMNVAPFAGARPVFIGDDVTDEDGFVVAAALGGFGVIVGQREPTAASYRLADPEAVRGWLAL